jgi:predicted kinase
MIISPDTFRYNEHGRYVSSSEVSALAWEKSFQALLGALQIEATGLFLLVGIPGAGKSTWLDRDPFAKRIGPKQDIYFDATLTRRVEREPLIQMAAQYAVPVEAIVFLTPIQVCLTRNWARTEDRRVPYPAIARMHENMRNEPVQLEEGFAKITAVRGV